MAFATYPAQLRAKVDAALALEQLYDYLTSSSALGAHEAAIVKRRSALVEKKKTSDAALRELEKPQDGDIMTSSTIVGAYRDLLAEAGLTSLVCNEAISNYPQVWQHLAPTRAGDCISSGASSLGWALGAAIGAQMAAEVHPEFKKDLTTVFVGDGSFIFGVPSASFWMARRYETPTLVFVFNNGVRPSSLFLSVSKVVSLTPTFARSQGWKSPKLSMLGVHPNGLGAAGPTSELNVSFGPTDDLNPNYGAIAAAAGGAWCRKVKTASELGEAMREAVRVVREEKRSAVLDCWLTRF